MLLSGVVSLACFLGSPIKKMIQDVQKQLTNADKCIEHNYIFFTTILYVICMHLLHGDTYQYWKNILIDFKHVAQL